MDKRKKDRCGESYRFCVVVRKHLEFTELKLRAFAKTSSDEHVHHGTSAKNVLDSFRVYIIL